MAREREEKADRDARAMQRLQRTDAHRGDLSAVLWTVPWKRFGFDYCCVYLISPVNGWPIKIGISDWPAKRLAALQTAHWSSLIVAKCWICEDKTKARAVEAKAHSALKREGGHLLGEWFDLRADKAAEIVEHSAWVVGVQAEHKLPRTPKFEAVFKHLEESEQERVYQRDAVMMAEVWGESRSPEDRGGR